MRMSQTAFLVTLFCLLLSVEYAGAQVYTGRVLDEYSLEPVPYVVVSLQNEMNEHVRHTSTGEDGSFLLVAPEVGNYFLHVKRIGYSENSAGPYMVAVGDTLSVQFRVLETTETLDEVTVEGTPYEETLIENYLESKNFYTRKNQGIGQFMTKKEIEERKAIETSALFTGIHGIKRFYSPMAGGPLLLNERTDCAPNIIINGISVARSTPLTLSGSGGSFIAIDNYVNIDKLVGMEVYTSLVGQPTEFGQKSHCGAVVFWTR